MTDAASMGRQCAAATLLGILGLFAGCEQNDDSRITTPVSNGGIPKSAPLSPPPPSDEATSWVDRGPDIGYRLQQGTYNNQGKRPLRAGNPPMVGG
jgi:hypothetical protein